MKRLLFLVLLAGAQVLAFSGPARAEKSNEDAAKKEYARFEGTWRITSLEADGTALPEVLFKTSRLILKGNEFTMNEGETTSKGTFKVDLAAKPKQIDITFTDGPAKNKTIQGIYELDGDTYKLCIALSGKERPTAFVTKAGSGHALEVLKREKADDKEEAVRKDLERLQGTWQLLSAETEGNKLPEDRATQFRVVIKGSKHSVYCGDKAIEEGVDFTLDPTQKPKAVEDTLKDGKKIRGIYELDGDTLRSCVAQVDKDRPTEFVAKEGTGHTLRVFQRVKE